ncbi:hypothetical protein [Nocardia brasiliensis]|uniref:hypothetical protein n=1 Tax=Nocardia brasiliensis TaxID=37326 RepID=UPI00366F42F1
MDGDEARSVIRDQDQVAHERLRELLAGWGREADAYASNIRLWLGTGWSRTAWKRNWGQGGLGRVNSEALQLFRSVAEWIEREAPWKAKATANLMRSSAVPSFGFHDYLRHHLGSEISWIEVGLRTVRRAEPLERYSVDSAIQRAHDGLRRLAVEISKVPLPDQLLDVPDCVHAPRHGWLHRGVVAAPFTEDLTAHIKQGRALEASLAHRAPASLTVHEWMAHAAGLLSGLGSGNSELAMLNDFKKLTSGTVACDSPVIADADALRRAYLALGLIYLEEVEERMPNYADESGRTSQGPQVRMTFTGGTFLGSQFAAQVANIDSTIAGAIQQSGSEVADAIKALEKAVLATEGIDDDHRQELLDNVEYLAEAAQTPPEERKRGMVRSALAALNIAALGGTALGDAMDAWGAVLDRLVP